VANLQLLDCLQPELVPLERVRYFQRQLLTAEDMIADQEYFRQKMRHHNRFLHGWGVVCGLGVTSVPGRGPWQVQIDSGYALGPYGDEIYVPEPVFLDLAGCGPGADTDPCAPGRLSGGGSATGGVRFVAIQYAECLARPMRALPAGCGCDELACEYSRIRDSFQIGCLDQAPDDPHLSFDLCNPQTIVPCPPCPTTAWVVLAKVTLPQAPTTPLPLGNIDNSIRRQIYSTAILQEQLITCCCGQVPQPLLRVANVRVLGTNPTTGQTSVLFDMQGKYPTDPPLLIVDTSELEAGIEVRFAGAAVNAATVLDQQTFKVEVESTNSMSLMLVPGQVTGLLPNNTVRWDGILQPGTYTVTLKGNDSSPIISTNGQPLDGEPKQLPSGDDQPGGDFFFKFQLQETPK
jgi:hypothetical protein